MNLETKLAGYYKIEIGKPDGSIVSVTDWFPNLITNQGLDYMATNTSRFSYCQVGSGSAVPQFTDVQLSSRVASSNKIVSSDSGIQSSPPYYASRTLTYSFSAGTATGNISEVGVGISSSSGLFSRALVVDGSGNPTSITVLSDEVLYVTYQIRYYSPSVDSTGSVTISGVSYSWVGRAKRVTEPSSWSISLLENTASNASSSNGTISSVTSGTTGTTSSATSITAGSYSSGSYSINYTMFFSLTDGNLSGGISAISSKLGNASYQISFSPSIPKDETKTLSIVLNHSWGRA